MANSFQSLFRTLALAATAGMLGCEGNLQINLTDAPLDEATEINVRITGIELTRSDDSTERVDFEPRTVDLTELSRGRTTLLIDSDEIGEGTFSAVSLILDAPGGQASPSRISLTAGGDFALALVANATARAEGTFTVEEDETTTITLDFDARASVLSPAENSDDYRLSPRLRLVVNDDAGTVRGTVDADLLIADTCDNSNTGGNTDGNGNSTGNAVYVFSGNNVTPDDLDNVGVEPLTSAAVEPASSGGDPDYGAAFLPAGDYTLALTCTARLDEADVNNDDVLFVSTQNVTVTAGQTRTANFE